MLRVLGAGKPLLLHYQPMKIAIAVGYAFLVIGILIRVFVPGLGVLGVIFAAVGGLTAAAATVTAAGKRRR